MAVLYAGVKNTFSRNALAKKLTQIVKDTTDTAKQATSPATNYTTLPVEEVTKLVAADATLIVAAPSQDGKTQAVMATAAGIAAVQAADLIVEKPKVVHAVSTYAIETGITLPTINRGGDRDNLYPFDALEIGQSFFVPATETMPNPAKTLASTVSTATRRYKSATPARVFTIRANVFQVEGDSTTPKGARIWRVTPPVEAPAPLASAATPAA